ncbi:HlyD family secretion protein [Granulosicoccus antarcticus]|uniref:Colicin V secretion protein CvaA n=1 Tax=Granulosicoccus antarcticus IMCC3135 TaxID=1192854 RepID=A0A2Z2P1V5_9GAMM|nr:HlyD family efflux transporter periplasmic adaptor subunit [Granulosicoccus antarcticus]ASJ73604.1 Colicin V secretion protein CvaA [Granulosicoccus antarcticus IMCC3135]
MRSSLFRKEALEQQKQPLEGTLLIAASPKATVLTLMAFVISICLVVYLCLGEFNRKASVQGYLSPDKGLVKVFPQVVGTLLERRVEEGMLVQKGQVLAVISTERGSLQVRDANGEAIRFLQARLDSLNNELVSYKKMDILRKQTVESRRINLADELLQLEVSIRTFKLRMQNSREESKRFEELKTSGFIASSDVYRQQDISMELRGRLQILERDRIALLGRQQALDTELASGELDSQLQQETLRQRTMELQQQRSEYQTNNEIVVAAPADGIVTTILIQPGQQTRRDAPLLSIIPEGARLEARLLVPSRAIGFVTPGQEVALRYAAFPYQRFGHYRGVVNSIARTLLLPGDVDLPTPLTSPAYLVTVDLEKQSVAAYDKEFPLQAGMSFDGDVLLDRRTIMQWMFDPLFSLTKRS